MSDLQFYATAYLLIGAIISITMAWYAWDIIKEEKGVSRTENILVTIFVIIIAALMWPVMLVMEAKNFFEHIRADK